MISPTHVTVTGVDIVTPSHVITDGVIVVRDGIIQEVSTGSRSGPDVVDGRGATLIPGLVDTHSDAFEKEIRPRPGVVLPLEFGLGSFEGRARAAGITTIFHGVAFEDSDHESRTVEQALAMCELIDAQRRSPCALIDHHVLHRLDVRDPLGLSALESRLDQVETSIVTDRPLVSFEDHTPGQGQYADRSWYERWVSGNRSVDPDEARRLVDDLIERRDLFADHRATALSAVSTRAAGGRITLMMHDPTSADEVSNAKAAGMSIAEFPTSLEAAAAAKYKGMRTVSGAPNAMRGTSHSGNVGARELIAAGLCDGLASDYLPTTLLGAVQALTTDGICSLPTAVGLVTHGPATTVGLHDRGRLEVGCRADMALVDFTKSMPIVRWVVSQHERLHVEAP